MGEPMETEEPMVNGDGPEVNEDEAHKSADKFKQSGNEHYKQKRYVEALQMYSNAIRLLPSNASYFGNRSATYMMLHKYKDAREDAKQSTTIDHEFTKGYQREGKCCVALGDALAAVQCFDKALGIEPDNITIQHDKQTAITLRKNEEEARTQFSRKDFRRAAFCIGKCLNEAPLAVSYRLFKAECLVYQGKYQEASEMANAVLMFDKQNSDAIFVRGLCLYYEDHIEKAQQHFKQVLRFNPDHKRSQETFKMSRTLIQKKDEGNQAFKSGNYEAALQLYTDALEIDPLNKFTNAKLYNNRATVNAKLNRVDDTISDCTKAIELDEKYVKAFQRRAKAYTEKEMYDEALRDYETVNKMEPSRDSRAAVNEAKLTLKKSKRKDYYKILKVDKNVSEDQLKKAYKRCAMMHHPDRHSHAGEEKRKEEETIFKDVGEAYAVLSDPRKKARYDSGADLDDESGGGGFHDFDPNSIFQMFFNGQGAGSSGFGFPDMGGMGGHHSRGGGPQTFHFQM